MHDTCNTPLAFKAPHYLTSDNLFEFDLLLFSHYFSLNVSADKITTLFCIYIFLKMIHFPSWLVKSLRAKARLEATYISGQIQQTPPSARKKIRDFLLMENLVGCWTVSLICSAITLFH